MRMLLIFGLMTGAGSLAALPVSAQQTNVRAGPTVSHHSSAVTHRNWGHRINGRWWGGDRAPGGWGAYRRPTVGFVLPAYWLQSNYYITDYGHYGLPAPGEGFGWSRYYDDAVLTDRYGKVYDSRVGYDWDRYDGYDDAPPHAGDERRGSDGRAVAGAVIGGVSGGLIGSAIAGPGSRTGGAIIGAGLGAIAGAAIGDATAPARRDDPSYGAPGYWHGARHEERRLSASERKLAREELKQHRRLDKLARKAGYASYGDYRRAREPRYATYAPPPPLQPHWAMKGGPEGDGHGADAPHVETHATPGYIANGYYYPGTTVTTITFDPGATR